MQTAALNESESVTLDGSGNGYVRIRPDGPAETWLPTVVHVSVSSNTSEAQCSIYAGPAQTHQYFVDATFSGSSGDASDRITGKVIGRRQLPYIWAVWSGGDPGAQATAAVTGTKQIP